MLPRPPLRVSAFFEEVASQTSVGAQPQHLLYLGHDLPLEASMKVVNLPSTSPERPLILLSYRLEANNNLPCRERKAVKVTFAVFPLRLPSSLFSALWWKRQRALIKRCILVLCSLKEHAVNQLLRMDLLFYNELYTCLALTEMTA